MPEPTSSTMAGGFAGWKLASALGFAGMGVVFAALVVACMRRPRSSAEWVVGLVSTVMGSIGGGSWVILRFDLVRLAQSADEAQAYMALVGMSGLVFACGLPAWAIVRWVFTWMARREGKAIDEVLSDLRRGGHAKDTTPGAI